MMTPVAEATLARAEALRLEAFYIGAWDNLKANQPEKQRGPCSLLFEGPCLQGKKTFFFFLMGGKKGGKPTNSLSMVVLNGFWGCLENPCKMIQFDEYMFKWVVATTS